MKNQDNYKPQNNIDLVLSQKIVLNFLPLERQEFDFPIYCLEYKHGDKSDEFNDCSRRRLPVKLANDLVEYSDYWVSFTKKSQFTEIYVKSIDNIYLTQDFLFSLLLGKCNNELSSDEYSVSLGLRSRVIDFVLERFFEGKRVVFLEPYFLKIDKKFGFLIDFRFISPRETKSSRRIQQLSLSLDKDGRSNKNFYVDRYEQIQIFLQKYYEKLFPISIGSSQFAIEKNLYSIKPKSLLPKKYIFSDKESSSSQFNGVKTFGPLEEVIDDPKIYFLFRPQDRSFANDLFKALRGDTYNSTFPGMETLFNYKFDKENVGGKEIESYDIESIEETIESIEKDANGRRVIPLLLIPFKKDGGLEAKHNYHLLKYIFLKRKIPSQFVSLIQLKTRDQLKWSVSNIALALFAKMGGKPWKVKSNTGNSLIVGIGQAHKEEAKRIIKYYAYSILTESTGLYKDLKILGQGTNRDLYLSDFKASLKTVFNQYYDFYDSFVVHTTFSISHEELKAIEEVLDSQKKEKKTDKKFIVMKFNDKNKFFGYSLTNNSLIPYESSFIQLAWNEYLVWFEGLQYHNPNVNKKVERPLHIKFLYPRESVQEQQMIDYLQDAVNISGTNWRGFNAKSLPVSIYYAYLVAKYYKEFENLDLGNINLENINPWFL
jgi:hypothetical protein